MKAVHIAEAFPGGVQVYMQNLSLFFGENPAAKEVATYIIYSAQRENFDPASVQKVFSGNVTMIEVPMVTSISPVKDARAAWQIYKLLKKINPDVIHLHSSKAGILGRVAHFLLLRKKKLFYTPHGYSFLRTDVPASQKKLFRLIEKYAQFFLGGTTIACGDTEFEIAKTIGRSGLIRNGISVAEIHTYYREPNNARLKVGIVGRITVPRAPALFNSIALRFPEIDFVWIGDGEMRHEITAPNITVTGWFNEAKGVLEQASQLDVYMQTSLWEGLPLAVIEAMALEKPVVATNVIGNKDIVVHGSTGFLFTDITELDACFEQLKNKDLRMAFGKRGYERAQLLFDKDKNFMSLLELYRS